MVELLESPDLEFEFYLAEKLGKTVAELRETLGAQEFLYWGMYFSSKAQRQKLELKSGK